MTLEKLTGLLCSMVEIPSFSREEGNVADFLQQWLVSEGFLPKREANNIWLDDEPQSSKPVLLLNAHIDTVKPATTYTRNPFKAEIENGCIYGLGTNDDGASLVALLGAWCQLRKHSQSYRLVWSATAEEEVSGVNGLERILPLIGPVKLGIAGEPTGMKMAVAERGLMVLDCTAHGVSGHAARKEGVNAISEAIRDIEWFNTFSFDKSSEFLGPVSMSVTVINAGTVHNVIPDRCDFVVDVRPNGMYSNEKILDTIRANVGCDVKPRSMRHNSSHIALDNPVVKRGLKMGLGTFGSPTTSNQTLMNFDSLKIGPGDSSRSHSADEYIRIDEISSGIDKYVKLLDNLEI